MRNFTLLALVMMSLGAFAQNEIAIVNTKNIAIVGEEPSGIIIGQVRTTDNQPAAFVSVYVKETNKATLTDENGNFSLRNLHDGVYTLEVSMVGLKPQYKTVEVKRDQPAIISFTLVEDAKQLTDIIITSGRKLNNKAVSAGKIDINPMDLPQSLTVVGSGMIREQQAQRLSDVIKNVNGVYLTNTRGNVQESFAARGYSFSSTNLFKNGSRINSGAMPEMSAIERVEVLKGSTAILFGQVAPGGIINMITKQPKFQQGAELSMRVGSYGLYKPTFDIYGPLNSNIAYRLDGSYENANSYRDGVSSERMYVNPSLLFKLGKKTELVTEGDFLYHRFTPDFGIGTIGDTIIPDVPRSRFMGTNWQYNKTWQTTGTTTLKHQFNDNWKLISSASYQYYKRDYYSVERIQAKADGEWTRPLGRILTDENYYAMQINLNGKFRTAFSEHTLLAGIDGDHSMTTNNDFNVTGKTYDKINILNLDKYVQRSDIPLDTATRKREAAVNRFGAYLQDLIKISDKLNFLAGIRWSYVETKGIDSTNLQTGAIVTGKSRYDKAFSPRFGIVYKPFKSTSIFTSYSNSFVVNSGVDVNGESVAPSIVDQYELGVKNEFWNGLLSANVTAYRIINHNLAQTAPFLKDGSPNNNTGIKQLTGETTSDGVEVDLASHPIKGLDITAGYSYNYMRYTKTDTTAGSFKEGERLVNNPSHTANATMFYNFTKGLLKDLKIGATVVYIGERFGGWNTDIVKKTNAQGQITGPFSYRRRLITVDGYTTLDLSAGYSFKKISLMGKVSNITNTMNYLVHENYSINPIPPTQFIATVSYKF